MFAAFEAITFLSFLPVWEKSREAALKYLLWNVFGAYLIFTGIALFHGIYGTFAISPVSFSARALAPFLLMFFGFAVKAALMPFHVWAPAAYSGSPDSFTPFFSGVVSKAGIFGYFLVIFKVFGSFFASSEIIRYFILYLGGLSALFAGIYAMFQRDAKKLLAYSSVSQLGYIAVAFFTLSPLSVAAGIFLFVSHAVFESLLFFVVAGVARETGTTDLSEMGGLVKKMPVAFAASLAGVFSVCGIPLTIGFPGKWMLYESLLARGNLLPTILVFAASLTAFLYSFKLIYSMFLGSLPAKFRNVGEISGGFSFPAVFLSTVSLLYGFFPGLILNFSDKILLELGFASIRHSRMSVFSSAGSFNLSPVVFVVVLSSILFLLIFLLSGKTRKVSQFDNYTSGEIIDEETSFHYASGFYRFIEREMEFFLRLKLDSFYGKFLKAAESVLSRSSSFFEGYPGNYIVWLGVFLVVLIFVSGWRQPWLF